MTVPSAGTPAPGHVSRRNDGLDLLRLLAVVLVIFSHVALPVASQQRFWLVSVNFIKVGGWLGVEIFFVLSGYLISGLLFSEHKKHGSTSIGRFLLRRGLKIYPAFWCLILATVAARRLNHQAIPARELVGELLFVQNYVGAMWGHTWSLAVEEHFYLLLALLVWVLQRLGPKKPFRRIPAIFVATALLCLALRAITAYTVPGFVFAVHYKPSHLRLDALFFGVFLSYCAHYKSLHERLTRVPTALFIAAGCVLLLPAFLLPIEEMRGTLWWNAGQHAYRDVTVNLGWTVGFDVFSLGSGLLVLGAVRLERSGRSSTRLLAGLGAASYSIYLWHLWVLQRLFYMPPTFLPAPVQYPAFVAGAVVICLVVGYVMARIVEIPVLHLRDRFLPSRSNGRTPDSGMLETAVCQ